MYICDPICEKGSYTRKLKFRDIHQDKKYHSSSFAILMFRHIVLSLGLLLSPKTTFYTQQDESYNA